MKRDLVGLHQSVYDLIVIGGGIYGAAITWDATLRGLSVALVEKEDFGHATSANSLKTIHGGLRYLQNLDFKRIRESVRERKNLMRIAPHLVHPLPFLIPTYGHFLKGKEVMGIAMMLNDLISIDRNLLRDPQKYLPFGKIISREQCLGLLPGIDPEGITGGAIWYDGQVYNSERLTLSFVKSAVKKGARSANYVEAIGLLRENRKVTGIVAQDRITGDRFDLRARTVVNATGPWADQVLQSEDDQKAELDIHLAKAINVVVRQLFEKYAVGFSNSASEHVGDGVQKGRENFLFISPWRDKSIIGTTYQPYQGEPDQIEVKEQEVWELLDQVNRFNPSLRLGLEDVEFVHRGLVPISAVDPKVGKVKRSRRQIIRDHSIEGLPGLISVIGVKYTTARDVAEKVVDLVFRSRGQKPPRSRSAFTSLSGGDIHYFEKYLEGEVKKRPYGLDQEVVKDLVYNYGTAFTEVLSLLGENISGPMPEREVLRAQVIYGVQREMAFKLSDVIFRRTGLGSAGHPGPETLEYCANVMREELGWEPWKMKQEIREVEDSYSFES